jgi:hypothetical protein
VEFQINSRIHKLMIHSGLTIGKNHGTAGAHGQNYRHFIVHVRDGGRDPMQADIVGFDGYPPKHVDAASRAQLVMKGSQVFENEARGSRLDWRSESKGEW